MGDSPYHRLGILQPRLGVSGYDASGGFTCLRTIVPGADQLPAPSAVALRPWPAGARGVPLAFGGHESPDPHADAPGATGTLGYILTVSVDGPSPTCQQFAVHVANATVATAEGHPTVVSASDSDSPNGAHLASGFGPIPDRRLTAATTHTAHADGTITTVAQTFTCMEAPGLDYSTLITASFPFSVPRRFSRPHGRKHARRPRCR